MLTSKCIIEAYELILGRQPESNDVVRHHVKNTATVEQLERSLISSEEFFQKMAASKKLQDAMLSALKNMDNTAAAEDHNNERQLVSNSIWSRLGRSAPVRS